jgi:probable biosynthetic protein (TIGR04098 family)
LIEVSELGYGSVGLGDLSEVPFMIAFATAQAHCMTENIGVSASQIRDVEGRTLYPAFYMTRLSVPPSRTLNHFHLWDRVALGLQVQTFGGVLLESKSILGYPGEFADTPEEWDLASFPTILAGSMFVLTDRVGEPQLSAPKSTLIADLPKLTVCPKSIESFRTARSTGHVPGAERSSLERSRPIFYKIIPGRDAASGCNIMFSKFIEIMDTAEHVHLSSRLGPRLPAMLLDYRLLLERETYYFAGSRSGDSLMIEVKSEIKRCTPNYHGPAKGSISVGLLTSTVEVFRRDTNELLAISRANKLMLLPLSKPSLVREAERVMFRHTKQDNSASMI